VRVCVCARVRVCVRVRVVCWLLRHALAQVVEVLHYKAEVTGSIPCGVLRPHYGIGVDSTSEMSTRGIYWGVKTAGL